MSDAFDVVPLPDRRSSRASTRSVQRICVKACRSGAPRSDPRVGRALVAHVAEIAPFAEETAEAADGCTLTDAQFVLARVHGFVSWPRFASHLDALARTSSSIAHSRRRSMRSSRAMRRHCSGCCASIRSWSRAVDARASVDAAALRRGERRRGLPPETPPNIVAIARLLLDAGADVDAEADIYGG